MALIHCNLFSNVLKVCVSVDVILPQGRSVTDPSGRRARIRDYPCLWLLHGLSDDHTIWQRRTSIERYADPLALAVVMPAVNRSFYADMASGAPYWTFLSEELPVLMRRMFRLSARREDNFVAGLSMGGYGALKLAMRCPDRFAAAASLSGALDMAKRTANTEEPISDDLALVYGNGTNIKGTDNDLIALARRMARRAPRARPAMYLWCGTEDFLIEDNRTFRDHARRLGLPLRYEEAPGGHDWQRWDEQIQNVLQWLPMRR